MQAQRAREQPITKGNLRNIALARAGGRHQPGDALAPHVEIFPRVSRDNGLARGAGRRVNAHNVLHRHGKQAVGIMVAQIGFHGEIQLLNILQACDIFGNETRLRHALAIKGNVVPRVDQNCFQLFELNRAYGLAVSLFNAWVPNHHYQPPKNPTVSYHSTGTVVYFNIIAHFRGKSKRLALVFPGNTS